MVLITHEQNIICSKISLDDITHEQTIICRQFFAGHVVGWRPMEEKKKLHRIIIAFVRRNMTFTVNELLTCFLNCDAGPGYD